MIHPRSLRRHVSGGGAHLLFLAVMMGSAGLSLLRVLAVAASLPKLDFGAYAAITAMGSFLGSLISAGAVEGTVKTFPRLAGAGHFHLIDQHASHVSRTLLLRATCCGVPVVILGVTIASPLIVMGGVAFAFAFSTAYISLVSSQQRALGDMRLIMNGGAFRAGFSFLSVVSTAQFGGLIAVLVAEFAAAVVGVLLYERYALRRAASKQQFKKDALSIQDAAGSERNDFEIFATYSLVSIPFYLDRVYITAVLGREVGAEYAVLALFFTVAMLLVNSVAAKAGPAAIKMAMATGERRVALIYIAKWALGGALIWLACLAAAAIALAVGVLPDNLAKYKMQLEYLVPVAVIGVLFNTALIEFLLMAFDRERAMLWAAVGYVGAILAAAALVALSGWTLLSLLWLLVAARAVYAALLLTGLRSAPPVSNAPHHV